MHAYQRNDLLHAKEMLDNIKMHRYTAERIIEETNRSKATVGSAFGLYVWLYTCTFKNRFQRIRNSWMNKRILSFLWVSCAYSCMFYNRNEITVTAITDK